MFTGLIESVGIITGIKISGNYKHLTAVPDKPFENIELGESIAVDGCCLTVTTFDKKSFTVEASQETLKTAITGQYKVNDKINLERALLPTGRLGGHFVQGHVDTTGTIEKIEQQGDSIMVNVHYPDEYKTLLVPRGSIAVNGISLTVTELDNETFTVNVIPHTQNMTTLQYWKIKDNVNLEFDMIGKYIARLHNMESTAGLTLDKLHESGW
jgi:riboflavin synthase